MPPLHISVRFTRNIGNYHGVYEGKEFPPAPSRLLQAIVAGTEGDARCKVVQALETLPPPEIFTAPQSEIAESSNITFVPNNESELIHTKARKLQHFRMFKTNRVHVAYAWGEVSPSLFEQVRDAVSCVGVLGKSMDLAVATVNEAMPEGSFDRWVPDDSGGVAIYTPVTGFLNSVLEKYRNGGKGDLRLRPTWYRRNPETVTPRVIFDLMRPDREATLPEPLWNTAIVAAWVRHAAIQTLPPQFKAAVAGHGVDDQHRVSILPLPMPGDYSDGKIRRVAIVGELAAIVAVRRVLNGKPLTNDKGECVGYLSLADESVGVAQYGREGKVWQTVTPCILPGLDSGKPQKRDKLIRRMFSHAGLPQPSSIDLRPWEPLQSLRPDEFFVPKEHDHHKCPRLFMRVEFAESVPGFIFVGKGRHYGLGLFVNASAPVR
jgi:CRISPR-associated protein Csb2